MAAAVSDQQITHLDVAAEPHHIVCGVAEAAGVVEHLGSEVTCRQAGKRYLKVAVCTASTGRY